MFEDDPKPDVRSDVFSLAATIWTLLAGRTPFEVPGKSNQSLELMGRIERGAITPMDRDDVPPALISVLRKGMAVDRGQRYATAVDFARALQGVELSLSYAPTQIDVPNISQAAAPVRNADENQDDRTRARGVTPVIAQPARPAITPPPAAEPPDRTRMRGATTISPNASAAASPAAPAAADRAAPVDSTVVRRSPRSVVSPDGAPAAGEKQGDAEPQSGRRRSGVVLAVAIGVAVVVAAVVAIAVLVPRGEPTAAKTSSTGGAPIDIATVVPTPVRGTAVLSSDGTVATFTWTDPSPVKGDSYVWQRTDGAGTDEVTPTTSPSASVTGVTPGTTVCIQVSIVRAGETSANPLKACTS
jgi:hypothetical protein